MNKEQIQKHLNTFPESRVYFVSLNSEGYAKLSERQFNAFITSLEDYDMIEVEIDIDNDLLFRYFYI